MLVKRLALAAAFMAAFLCAPSARALTTLTIPFMAPPASDTNNTRVLAAGVAESFTVPAGANYVIFSSTCDFWANFTTTAAIPSNDITNGSSSFPNPTQRSINGATSISVITSAASCYVTAAFYQ